MAQCINCGAQIPATSAFCPECGARQPADRAPEEIRPTPQPAPFGADVKPAAAKKGKTGLIIGIAAAVVLVGLLLVLLLTGVLGGGSKLEGVWVLAEATTDGFQPGDIVLNIDRKGSGSARIRDIEVPMTWTKDSITINGVTDPMHLDGDQLIVEESGEPYVFRRSGAAQPAPAANAGAFGGAGDAEPKEEPAVEEPAVEEPAAEEPVVVSTEGAYWDLPPVVYAPSATFPCGPWYGSYVYNGYYFKSYFQLNEDHTCTRRIYRDGEIVTDEAGRFEYDGAKIKIYANGETNKWTEYEVTDEMMVNNNHEFFRKDPGGVIGAWIGDYMYNEKHIHTTIILRTDGTYSEVTFRDGEKVKDEEGTYVMDGKGLYLVANGNSTTRTPFDIVDDALVNNNHYYRRN